ncbi:MAG: hypothetical protein NZ580_07830 [Bacteroidia bacterium]|nr:hypothetical protein [Bacteroidia bacterium]MDW8236637.1 hypothetical protein [Bacteroidia bacterium]
MTAERILAHICRRERQRASVWVAILLGVWLVGWIMLIQTLPQKEQELQLTEEEQWEELAYYYPIDL